MKETKPKNKAASELGKLSGEARKKKYGKNLREEIRELDLTGANQVVALIKNERDNYKIR